jgi:hypothetical protein
MAIPLLLPSRRPVCSPTSLSASCIYVALPACMFAGCAGVAARCRVLPRFAKQPHEIIRIANVWDAWRQLLICGWATLPRLTNSAWELMSTSLPCHFCSAHTKSKTTERMALCAARASASRGSERQRLLRSSHTHRWKRSISRSEKGRENGRENFALRPKRAPQNEATVRSGRQAPDALTQIGGTPRRISSRCAVSRVCRALRRSVFQRLLCSHAPTSWEANPLSGTS